MKHSWTTGYYTPILSVIIHIKCRFLQWSTRGRVLACSTLAR